MAPFLPSPVKATRLDQASSRWVAAAVLALLVSSGAGAADYGPTIASGTSSNSERKLALAADGTIFATYTQPVNNTTAVFVKQSKDGGASWTALPPLGTGEAFRSCVAVDSKGTLHVAWTEFVGPDRQVFYARWEGGPNWTGALQLSDTPGYSGFPSLAVDSQDRVHVVWYGFDGANYQVYYRYLEAGAWRPTVQATSGAKDANNPAIAVGPDDQVHVAFFSYFRGETDVWYMVGGPAGWNNQERVNPAGVPSADPSIVVLPNGTAAIAYTSGQNATQEVRYAERDAAGNWSVNDPVSALGEGASHASLAASGRNEAAVFFETAAGELRFRVRSPVSSSPWSSERALGAPLDSHWASASWATFPSLPQSGNVSVLWTQDNGTGYDLGFASVKVFDQVSLERETTPPWWKDLLVPLFFLLIAGATLAGLGVAMARTKGGGRG